MKDWAAAEELVEKMSGGKITPGSTTATDETKEFLHHEVIEILEQGVDEDRLPPISIEEEKQ